MLYKFCIQPNRNVCFTTIARVEQNRVFTPNSWEILILETCADTFLRVTSCSLPPLKFFVCLFGFFVCFVLFQVLVNLQTIRVMSYCPWVNLAIPDWNTTVLCQVPLRKNLIKLNSWQSWDLQHFWWNLREKLFTKELVGLWALCPDLSFPLAILHVPPLILFTQRRCGPFQFREHCNRRTISTSSGWWNMVFQPISSDSTACTRGGQWQSFGRSCQLVN